MDNPLLEIAFEIPFDRIRAEHVVPAITELIERSRAAQRAIGENDGPKMFENTMMALDRMTETLDWAFGIVHHIEAVATYPEFRAAFNEVQQPVAEYYSQITLDPALWRVLKDYAASAQAAGLTGTRKRFLEKRLDEFRREGAELDDAGKKRLKEIDVELSQLTTKFAENVLDTTNAFELILTDERQLAGLPPSAIEAARENALSKKVDGWRFTLQAPSYTPLMTYLEDREVRRHVWHAYSVRASSPPKDNREILSRVLELRRAKAELLGFRDFADLVLHDRMAHTGAAALAFVERLRTKTEQRFQEENEELRQFRKNLEGADAAELEPWDVAYYAEKQRKALYDFDEEQLRPYFPLEQVVAGMFEVVRRLYGIQVAERPGLPVWDAAVKTYAVEDADGSHLGSFYADWFPRENKRPGAWMDAFLTGRPTDAGWEPHLGMICGNVTPPVGNKPALLTHNEVETIFHEFGHLLHHLLSRVDIRTLAGTHVAWDFVELPSQIMENWCWEREALDLFARHYETGETLPEDLFQKMKRARNFRAANAQMRQLGFATLDLLLHTTYSPVADGDVMQYARAVTQQFAATRLPADYAMIASFTHLFASPVGYGAGYYSYKWAEVLDADAFSRFHSEGLFSPVVGADFRAKILARGDSEDPAELYRSFMGRDPDEAALLERSGLLAR